MYVPLLLSVKEFCLHFRAWVFGLLPQVMDRETSVQEKCFDLLEEMILQNLKPLGKYVNCICHLLCLIWYSCPNPWLHCCLIWYGCPKSWLQCCLILYGCPNAMASMMWLIWYNCPTPWLQLCGLYGITVCHGFSGVAFMA